jgi:PAS domain S-box-containing protein
MLGEDGRKLQEFYEQLPFGVTIEDFSLVKKRIDQLQESGVHDIELYLLENPDERKKMVRTIQATSANSSMLDLYQVNSFQEYLDLYSDIADWENTGWAESYSQIIANLAQVKSHSSEYIDITAKGEAIHIGYVSWVLKGHEQDWTFVISTHEDITERKRDEKRVKDSEARLRGLFENAPEGMFFKDADGRYVMVNQSFADRMGTDDISKIIGKTVFDIFPKHDAEKYRLDDILCMYTRQVSTRELEVIQPDGDHIIQTAIKFPIVSEDGSVTGVGGIDVDITELKKLDRMKNEFVSTVSHELRTPLTSIKGSLGLMNESTLGNMTDNAKSMVDIAHKNTDRLINLVNDLLDMEKLVSDGIKYDFEFLDLSNLVTEAVESDHDFIAEHAEKFITTDIANEIKVSGDAKRLKQVIANLLSNAIKFSPDGGEIKVAVSCCKIAAKVSFTDHGVGIDDKFKDHIFERFAQIDSSDSRKNSGTGLGLNISKLIIEKHGGEIGLDSKPGVGSTFFFTLPLHTSNAKA